jgi:hypothetical protein
MNFIHGLTCVLFLGQLSPIMAQNVSFSYEEPLTAEGLPRSWRSIKHPFAGWPQWSLIDDPMLGKVLRGESRGTSGGVVTIAKHVDLARTPWLNFSWKVEQHPNGTVANKNKSDQAMIIYVDFGKMAGAGPFAKRDTIAYLYDSQALSESWHDDSTLQAKVWAKVLDTGGDDLGKWKSHSVNVFADYRQQFGRNPPYPEAVSLYCNSNNSDSSSLGFCSALEFSGQPKK